MLFAKCFTLHANVKTYAKYYYLFELFEGIDVILK